MTTINFKKSKTTTSFIAALVIGLIMSSPMTLLPYASAQTDPAALPLQQLKQMFPAPLSHDQLSKMKQLVIGDTNIAKSIDGKPYKFMAQDFVGSYKILPEVWKPEIHINVNNETEITVVADPTISSIETSKTTSIFKIGQVNPTKLDQVGTSGYAYSIDQYDGTQSSIYGIKMNTQGPSNSETGTEPFRAFLVNGAEYGATDANLCDSAYDTSSFFGQAGLAFEDNFVAPIWSDTDQSCTVQAPLVTYTVGDHMVFEIISGSPWVIYGEDADSSTNFFDQTDSNPTYGTMETNDPNTSIFFENHDTGTSWGSYISNPSAVAHYMNSGASWVNWDGEKQNDMDCSGNSNVYPYNSSKQVISNSLDSGGTATWSMSRMASEYPAC